MALSYSGEDPENDPLEWSGGPSDFDLTPRQARLTSRLPFGNKQIKVSGSILQSDPQLEIGRLQPQTADTAQRAGPVEGITARPIRGADSENDGTPPTEFTVVVDTDEIELELTATVAFVSNDSAVTAISTSGSEEEISLSNEIITAGESVEFKVAADEKILAISADNPVVEIREEELIAEVTTPEGAILTQTVNDETPTVEIVVTEEATTVTTVQDDVAIQTTVIPEGEDIQEQVEVPILLDLETNEITVGEQNEIYMRAQELPLAVTASLTHLIRMARVRMARDVFV